MVVIIIGIIIALLFFFYFQRKNSDRNLQRFERSREKYEELLARLRNANEKNKAEENNTDNK